MPTSQSAGLDRSGGKVPRPAGGSRTLDSWRGIRLRAPAAPEGALGPGPSAHPGAAPRPRRGVANGCCRAPRADVCGDAWLAKRATSRLGPVRRGRGPRHNSQGTAQQRTPLPNRRCAPQARPARSHRRRCRSRRPRHGLDRPGRSWPPGTPPSGRRTRDGTCWTCSAPILSRRGTLHLGPRAHPLRYSACPSRLTSRRGRREQLIDAAATASGRGR
jgi:hypothetical protein